MKQVFKTLRFTKKLALALGFSILLSQAGFAKTTPQALDQIVAVVNDDVITRSELDHAIYMSKMQLSQQNTAMPSDADLKKQVLKQLTNKKLQLQVAKQSGVVVTDKELNEAIGRIAEQNHISVSDLYDQLKNQGLSTTEYRDEIRNQMTMHKLQQQEIVGHLTVTPEEINKYVRSQAWLVKGSDQEYHLEDILVPIPDAPKASDIASAKERANAIVARIHKGESFQAIAAQSGTGPTALQGGDLGWRKLPEIPSAFAKPVASMKLNDVAGPIQTENGFHIIRLAELRNGSEQDKPSTKQIENMLLQRKFEEAVQTWLSKLRASAFISMNAEFGKEKDLNA